MKVLLDSEPPHLDPLDDPPRSTLDVINGLIYEPLIECSDAGLRPALAERWEWIQDGSRLLLQLRPGVRWHDGTGVSAADVQASIEAFLRGRARQSVAAAALTDVVAVEALEGAVRLRLSRSGTGVLHALCEVPVVPAPFARAARGKAAGLRLRPVGTGPFRLTAWERGQFIRLERNPTAWRGAAALDELLFEVELDPWRRLLRARKGEVDLLAPVPARYYPEQVRRGARAEQVGVRRVREERYSFLAVNHQHPALGDPAVRRALALLWNRPALSQEVHHGLAEPVAAPFGSEPATPYDPKLAASTLVAAGWREGSVGVRERGGTALRLSLLHAGGEGLASEIELRRFSTNLARAGVRLEVVRLEPAALLQRVRGRDFDLVPLIWSGRAGEDPSLLFSQTGRFNHGGFRSARVQALMDELRGAQTPEVREAASARLARAVAEELPVIYLYRHDSVALVTRRVRELCTDGGRIDLRAVWLEPGT